jgi:SAM-dependent methyltransferase
MGVFNGWFSTRWYGMLYRHRDERDAAALARQVIAKGALHAGMSLLDMACGRGRHTAFFLAEGLEVTGIDLSEVSIKEAAQAHPAARFVVHDMREPFTSNAFDAVVCLFTSLGYTADRGDDERALRAAGEALKPGGLFVLDLMNGDVVRRTLVPMEVIRVGKTVFRIARSLEGGDIVKRITVEHQGRSEEFREHVHAWNGREVQDMVARCGLQIESATDSTGIRPFDPESSDRIVVWARKKP